MDFEGFGKFLEGQGLTHAGVQTRKRFIKVVEEYLEENVDEIVGNDDRMYDALSDLYAADDPAHTPRKPGLIILKADFRQIQKCSSSRRIL